MRHMWDEFKDFAMKGNALDLAIGVIIGAAFSPIVSTLVANVLMPIIGYITAGVNLANLEFVPVEGVDIKYGLFLNAIIQFLGNRAVLPHQGHQHGAQAQARGARADAVGDLFERDPRRS
jgi:large-conductance mechanosensitive channel